MTTYCEVALPVPLRTAFTYAVPESLGASLAAGCRVVAPFRRKSLVGVVLEIHARPPAAMAAAKNIREISRVLDAEPALTTDLLALGQWLAGYYLAPVGEVFRAMLPPLVEVQQQRILRITEAGRVLLLELHARDERTDTERAELAVLEKLAESSGGASGAIRETTARRISGDSVARLLSSGAMVAEEVVQARRARSVQVFAWNAGDAPAAEIAATELASLQRIREVLCVTHGPLPLAALCEAAQVKKSQVLRLHKLGTLRSWRESASGDAFEDDLALPPPVEKLNAAQESAAREIGGWLAGREFAAGLLFGVTGSGKTEVYLRAMQAALEQNRGAILLVPEIALTLQAARICRARFGERVAVLHSGMTDTERAREWWRVRRGEAPVVVGTRSAAFAPLSRPGLLIVDEEQESAYKQEESPRYHGRDVAVMRAKLEGAVALLGSATPSLESFTNARAGKYRLLRLDARVDDRPLARVEVVDLRQEFQRTRSKCPFSQALREAMAQRLARGEQSLVLMNRRGWSWFVLCRSCGAAVQCENCSIALTYHKRRERLACHYCGYSRGVPKACPKCESPHIYFVGEGSEQIEEQLKELFPRARIARLDRDTARTRRQYHNVLAAFARRETDILTGTQMLAKGHDFHRVTLAGVVSADLQLGLPDFRAAERTFQLLTQVAGRAGRGELRGDVLVQTYYPEHYAIRAAARQDYEAFYEREIEFRARMHYPPHAALALVLVRDKKQENAVRYARAIEAFFNQRNAAGIHVLGPAAAPLARLKQEHRYQFLLKAARRGVLSRMLGACLDFCAQKEFPANAVIVDMDPVSLL